LKKSGRQFFTADEYRRLARNPFVDRQMLQFVKNKTVAPAGSPQPTMQANQEKMSSASCPTVPPRRPVQIRENTARLIAMTISAMMRE
jgi:hypothetical protein